ncbi:hypothetical protein HC891_01600 [Candidatus Gracilibacteria bacterium]|nr:hypothetical protein [Candidatus Gracilibacteria bacterium]
MQTFSGTLVSAADGMFNVPLPSSDTVTQTMDATLLVATTDARLNAAASSTFTRFPQEPQVGVRAVEPFVEPDDIPQIEVLALGGDGRLLPNTPVIVDIFVRATTRSAPLLTRRVVTDAQGRATAAFVRLRPGTYAVVARLGQSSSEISLYAVAPGFTGWPAAGTELTLVADKPRYRPGEQARLLVASPFPTATLLLASQYTDVLDGQVRAVRAGDIITLTVTPAMAPALTLDVAAIAPGAARFGTVQLPIISPPPLTATLSAADGPFEPGASVPLTLTISSTAPISPAEVMSVIQPETSGRAFAPSVFFEAPSASLRRARTPFPFEPLLINTTSAPLPTDPVAALAAPGVPQRVSSSGVLNTSVALPATPGTWRVATLIRVGDEVVSAETVVTSTQMLVLSPIVPAALRVGDSATVSLLIRNLTAQTRAVQLELNSDGARLASGQRPRHSLTLPPNSMQTVDWRITPDGDTPIALRFRADDDTGRREERETRIALLPSLRPTHPGTTIAALAPFTTTLSLPPGIAGVGAELAFAPDIYAAVLSAEQALATATERNVEQEASLLLLRIALARAGDAAERGRWQEAAAANIATLRTAQQSNAAWGYWHDTPPQPFITGYVLEALAAARDDLALDLPPLSRALVWLRNAESTTASPDLRAYLLYVQSRYGPADIATARLLLAGDLQAESIAYLALALPLDEAEQLQVRLTSQVRRNSDGAYWESRDATPVAHSRLSTTALVTRALRRVAPGDELRDSAVQVLYRGWSQYGWPTSYDSARVAAALLADGKARLQRLASRSLARIGSMPMRRSPPPAASASAPLRSPPIRCCASSRCPITPRPEYGSPLCQPHWPQLPR